VCIKLARFSGFQPPNFIQVPLQPFFYLKLSLDMAILFARKTWAYLALRQKRQLPPRF